MDIDKRNVVCGVPGSTMAHSCNIDWMRSSGEVGASNSNSNPNPSQRFDIMLGPHLGQSFNNIVNDVIQNGA